MKRLLVFFLLSVSINLTYGQVSPDSIRAIITREVAAKRGKSIIVGIIDSTGRRQVFAAGVLSDRDRRQPDGYTLYEIGSITKVFTSLLLADMSVKHQLNITDPISNYLPPNVKAPQLNGREITLLSLSTHRSGMPRFPYNVAPKDPDNPYADYTPARLYEYVSPFQPPDIDTRWRYSNVAYGLLGLILEKITGNHFEALVTQRICQPLHMPNTTVTLNAQQRANLAVGHAETGAVVGLTKLGAIGAGGALCSNVNDLLTFAAANLGPTATNLLPAMEETHLLRAPKDGEGTYTTMGWTLSKDSSKYLLFKDGGMPGYRSFLGIDKINKFGVVVLCNNNNSVTDIGRYILDPGRKIDPYKYPWALLDTLRSTLSDRGVDATVALYNQLKTSQNTAYIFNELQLNYLGNELRKANKVKEAISIYELNAREYPTSTLVYESLAETHKLWKDKPNALRYFEMARKLDPQNQHWTYMIEKLAK
ncbi:beta-lactamase family protein [Paraflavitalea sp. CAU 1676]|uniref:beta-lactamase family protein n=1 Tax=Paraflavitalea sp. CAU 1676 TaxID=3032598 RepID=UPI0023DB8C02|nr:beta-lactamase family protein [Paraflavitalea sp. CAU 1676]MDF2193476.1 beta-lactamase family protein [Paraflavitalea sp. CAU 1676]